MALQLANKGLDRTLKESSELQKGLITHKGKITHDIVAKALESIL